MSTRGVELLSAIFLSKKKNGVFDIPALYFKEWCNSKTFPVIDKHDCIYGDFLFDEKIRDFIESYYDWDELYDENVMDFRKKCIRELIFEIVPDRLVEDVDDYITPHDISNFMQTIAKNRIRDDAIVKSQIPVFTSYMAWGTVAWNSDIEAELIKKDDDLSVRLENEWLETLEKEARKKCIAEPYIPYVENLNLEMLKHLLKDNLGNSFVPQWRQKDTLCKLRRFNFFACSRRSGKSFLGSYLAARQFYIPNQVIVYIVPTLRTHGKVPRRYLFMMLKGDPNISFNRADRTITNRKNWSEIIFFSGEREDSVRWAAANLLIFDEAAFLSEELYTTAEPLIRTTNGIVYCISTVNTKTPKNWFYYKLVEAEITKYDMNTNKYWLRVSLRENPFIPDAEKQSIAEDGKQNIKLFQAEWMAEFQDGDSFDFSKFWIIDYNPVEIMIWWVFRFFIKDEAIDKTANFYDHFIICHDSAKLKDRPWLAVIGVKFKKNATGELVQQWCEIVGSWYMSGFEYMDQVDLIMKLKDILWKDKTTIVIEYNHGWVTVEELFRRTYNQYVIPVQTIGGVTYIRDGNIWRVGKDLMMGKLSSAIDRWVLRWYSFMEQLRIEIETFDVNESQQTRKAWHHFDIMSAILVGVFFADYSWYMEMYKDTDKDVRADRWHESFGDIWSMNRYKQDNRSEMSRLDKFGY